MGFGRMILLANLMGHIFPVHNDGNISSEWDGQHVICEGDPNPADNRNLRKYLSFWPDVSIQHLIQLDFFEYFIIYK